MRKDWDFGTLEDVVNKGSSNISLNKIKEEEGEFPVYGAKGFVKNVSFFQQEKEYLGIIKDGAGIGRVSKHPANSSILATMQYIIPKDGFDIDFIYYFLNSIDFEKHRNGSTIPHIYFKDYKSEQFPLVPLPEQKRIVSILDKAFAAIDKVKANAERNLNNTRELFESYLQGVFDNKDKEWGEQKLGDVFYIGSSKRIMEKDWTSDGVPFYGGKEIVKLARFGCAVSNAFISEEKYNDYASKYDMPQQDDILITARGTIGIGYIVKKGDKFYYKDGNIISMRAKTPTNPTFILYAFKSNVLYDQLRKLTGATVKHLPINKAKELVLSIPDLSIQNTIVDKIQKIENETKRLEAICQQKILNLEELKKSILQKAFNGEL